MKKTIVLFFCCLAHYFLSAQMWNEAIGDTLYGNEWINFENADRYYKIKIGEDGIYRLTYQSLLNANIPVQNISAGQYQLFRMGEEVPIYSSRTNESLAAGDYIEFYGQKNRSELDRHLFKAPDEEMLNPAYSLINDTMIYFLTWTEVGEGLRYENVVNDLTGNLPPKKEWFIDELFKNYTARHFKNYTKVGGLDLYYAHFDVAEGYATTRSVNRTETLSPPALHPSSSTAALSLRLATNIGEHQLNIAVNDENYIDTAFASVQLLQLDWEVALTSESPNLNILIEGLASNVDQHVLSNIKLKYRRRFDFGGEAWFRFELPASGESQYLEIENFDLGNQNPILYDLSNQIRLEAIRENGLVKVLLPPSSTQRELLLHNNSNSFQEMEHLEQRNFRNYNGEGVEFVILSHSYFYKDGQDNNWVQEYANYRSSQAGGGFTTAVIDVEELYDQFAYGVYGHPLSIRNFAHYIKKEWLRPTYFFLIGKGREMVSVRKRADFEAAYRQTFFVPTFGWPASDNLLFSNNYSSIPLFAIGRLAITNTNQLRIYLDKVKEHDQVIHQSPQTIEDIGWTKHLLHLGGGGNGGEQTAIKGALEAMANVVENGKMGAIAHGYYKSNTEPVQEVTSDAIFDRLNRGTSMLTFFGHSGANTLDFNIDNPDRYFNKGKYPFMMALGCNVGNIFTESSGISERFCFL